MLLYDGHPGRPENPVAFARTGYGGRLDAYPTRNRWSLSQPEMIITAVIVAAKS